MSNSFCLLPWIHLATHPDGAVSLCCVSDHTNGMSMAKDIHGKMLSLNQDNLDSIYNSHYFKEVRLQMLANEVPEACRRCFEEESKGKLSKRIEEANKFNFTFEDAKRITDSTGKITTNFKFIELRLGNVCNIKCRSCNPNSSTKWSGEYALLQKDLDFVTKYDQSISCSWTENDSFWNQLLDRGDGLELVYINGGEPTLVKKHTKFLKNLIERGYHKNITLWYNINMTNLPADIVELWSEFKKVIVFASIDDLGIRNSYLRSGTNWDVVMQNLDTLQSHSWIELSICQTVSWMNIYYLDEFYQFMAKRNLKVHQNIVYDPKFLDPNILPQLVKDLVLEKLSSIEPHKINFLKNHFASTPEMKYLKQGFLYNDWLDKSRNEKFSEIFPEWHKILKEHMSNFLSRSNHTKKPITAEKYYENSSIF